MKKRKRMRERERERERYRYTKRGSQTDIATFKLNRARNCVPILAAVISIYFLQNLLRVGVKKYKSIFCFCMKPLNLSNGRYRKYHILREKKAYLKYAARHVYLSSDLYQ